MIEIQQNEQPSETLVKLMRQLADARRGLHATEQALSEARAELKATRPMAAAGHTYCASLVAEDGEARFLQSALLDVHRAQTPSETPSSHVIMERAELEGLRTENAHLGARVRDLSAELDRLRGAS